MSKVTSQHLEQLRLLLLDESANLGTLTKALATAHEARDQKDVTVRALQASFDIAASAYASDSDLSVGQLEQLAIEAQKILGYTKPAKATPAPAV